MLRNVIIISAVVAASASVPLILETHPEAFKGLVGGFKQSGNTTEVLVPVKYMKSTDQKNATTRSLSGRRVLIEMDRNGHFNGEFKLNGRRIKSLVDTGATLVAINRSTARQIGLKLRSTDFKYDVSTANGSAKAAAAKIKSLQIGRIHVSDVEALVLEDRALDGALIGMSFLNQLRNFRVEGGKLYLEQ